MYKKPEIEVTAVNTARLMEDLLGSGTAPQPAPAHVIVNPAPPVPGGAL